MTSRIHTLSRRARRITLVVAVLALGSAGCGSCGEREKKNEQPERPQAASVQDYSKNIGRRNLAAEQLGDAAVAPHTLGEPTAPR